MRLTPTWIVSPCDCVVSSKSFLATASFEQPAETLDYAIRAERMLSLAEAAPSQALGALAEQIRGAGVEIDDLKIDRPPVLVPNHGERDHAFVTGVKDRVDQAVFRAAFSDIDRDERRPPPVRQGKRENVVALHLAMANEVRRGEMGSAILDGALGRVRQRAGKIRLQLGKPNVPVGAFDPTPGVAAGAMNGPVRRIAGEDNDVVVDAAETVQQQLFVRRQPIAHRAGDAPPPAKFDDVLRFEEGRGLGKFVGRRGVHRNLAARGTGARNQPRRSKYLLNYSRANSI